MNPRTPRQRLQLVMAAIMLACAPLSLYDAIHRDSGWWLGYFGAATQLGAGVMFLCFGLSRKDRL